MIFLARLPIVFLTIALALVGFHFARQIWNKPSGTVAFMFLLFDPNLMAHGRYSTTDLGGTLFIFLAAFLLWRCWQVDNWQRVKFLMAGLGLSLAFGSKLSSLAFVPIFFVMALLPLYQTPWTIKAAGRRVVQLITAGLFAIPIVWAIFAFQWGLFNFQSEPFSSLNSYSGPMPTFWAGIEQILAISGGGRPTFLLGEFSSEGFIAYFPIAFLVKTPLPVLILLAAALIWLLYQPNTRKKALFLVVPAGIYFLLSMQSALNIGYRHLLPILPFLSVLISGLTTKKFKIANLNIQFRPLMAAALMVLLVINLWIYPHYLSYFNLAAGGPTKGGDILVDSNIDWGQDLLRLQDWMAENEVEEVKLSWFGSADPAYYGLAYEPLPGLPRHFNLWWDVPFNPANPEPGIYAISASNLWEIPLEDKTTFPWFRAREADDRIGYSIFIYRVIGNEPGQ
jgi:4-amino-4-deoxy-L-arabinose transferase-like glycosyltransferase